MAVTVYVKPTHCPNCGAESLDIQTCIDVPQFAFNPYCPSNNFYIFDCYCKKCGWSGDISPDEKIWDGEKWLS